MYTLYYSPGSCSLIVHCLLEEFGVPFELKRVDAASKDEYRKLNPKGKVPALAKHRLEWSNTLAAFLNDK